MNRDEPEALAERLTYATSERSTCNDGRQKCAVGTADQMNRGDPELLDHRLEVVDVLSHRIVASSGTGSFGQWYQRL